MPRPETEFGEAEEKYMHRALTLAERGRGRVSPNPLVGCVLVKDGRVVGEGWHQRAGSPHAEANALTSAGSAATGATAYVTLEPCNHTGRTGPCSEALVAAGVARVVYAVSDPNPVASGGSDHLRRAGIDVVPGVLADEAAEFMRRWLVSATHRRPFVTVKWAQSLDGRVAAADGTSQWITGAAARQHVHEQRAAHDAIVVGTGTVLADDPSLTARGDAGELLAEQPMPVVLGDRPVPDDARLRQHPHPFVQLPGHDVAAALGDLHDRGVRSVFVEGGPTLASAVIAAGLADELLVYIAPALLGGGRVALTDVGVATITEAHRFAFTEVRTLGDDVLLTARPNEREQ